MKLEELKTLNQFNELPKEEQEQFLKANFEELEDIQKDVFLAAVRQKTFNTYGALIPKGVTTHTIALETGFGCIITEPSAKVLGQVMGKLGTMGGKDPDIHAAGVLILDNCWIAGDSIIENDEYARLAASLQSLDTVQIMQGSIKKN